MTKVSVYYYLQSPSLLDQIYDAAGGHDSCECEMVQESMQYLAERVKLIFVTDTG